MHKGNGCENCLGLGHKGRTGIFELLCMTPDLRSCIVQQPSFDAIYEQVRSDGMQTLTADGIEKVQQGIIPIDELIRSIS